MNTRKKKNEIKWKRSKSSITRIFLMILKFLFSLMFSLSLLLRFVYGCFSLQFTSLFCLRFSFLLFHSMLDRFLFILNKDWKFNDAFFSSFLSELLFSISSSKWCFRWVEGGRWRWSSRKFIARRHASHVNVNKIDDDFGVFRHEALESLEMKNNTQRSKNLIKRMRREV